MRRRREGDRIGSMNERRNALERIPTFEELEIAYYDLERRAGLGEKLPLHRITLMLSDQRQFTGVLIEPKDKGNGGQAALRLDSPADEIVIFHRSRVSACLLSDIKESGQYFFESWIPEGPRPGPLEVRTLAKDGEKLLKEALGKGLSVKLPGLPALSPERLAVLGQCILDLCWVLFSLCRVEAIKEEFQSGLKGLELRTAEGEGGIPFCSLEDGNLALNSSWERCFASASGRSALWRMIEELF
jgi:hypothetical protein